jgi:hypothetical protein
MNARRAQRIGNRRRAAKGRAPKKASNLGHKTSIVTTSQEIKKIE